MKYAREVIELLAAYPGREFRMIQIVRHVSSALDLSVRQRNAVRQGVLRVLDSLQNSGQVQKIEEAANSVLYVWRSKVRHDVSACVYSNCDNAGAELRLNDL